MRANKLMNHYQEYPVKFRVEAFSSWISVLTGIS
jgi:hypothetical protein